MAEYDISEEFERIEHELITSMMRNFDGHRAEEDEMGINWSQWQIEQLQALEEYKRHNAMKYGKEFKSINSRIDGLIRQYRKEGNTKQEVEILKAIKKGFNYEKTSPGISEKFFKLNDKKIDALIDATTRDFEKAEYALLRRANDQYRQIVFSSAFYATTGGTYEKAVDMATKDFLKKGIDCIEYKNGSRHNIKDYADMAIKTAGKRAYLTGEGEKRKEYGISTVIMNKRGNPCPLCRPFCGKVMVDDVWSGGSPDGISPVTGIKYPTMSSAVVAGLYHPRCRDAHSTYYEGISTMSANDEYTKEELTTIAEDYKKEQELNRAIRQAESYARLEAFALDKGNKRMYEARREEWEERIDIIENSYGQIEYRWKEDKDRYFRGARFRTGDKSAKEYANDRKFPRTFEDVTEEYIKNATPGIGNIVLEDGILDKDEETAKWLFKLFGGNIKCLKDNSKIGKMPDALWNDTYWEFKEPSSKTSIDKRLRKAREQITEVINRDGKEYIKCGNVIDITNRKISLDECVKYIEEKAPDRCLNNTDIIIRDKDKVVKILRVKK